MGSTRVEITYRSAMFDTYTSGEQSENVPAAHRRHYSGAIMTQVQGTTRPLRITAALLKD